LAFATICGVLLTHKQITIKTNIQHLNKAWNERTFEFELKEFRRILFLWEKFQDGWN